jgi:hypothetical protein
MKIQFDLRQSIMQLVEQLQREGVMEHGDLDLTKKSLPFRRRRYRRIKVSVPPEIVAAIQSQN